MKLRKHIQIAGLAIVLMLAMAACAKKDFNINSQPNVPTDSTISYDVIFPAALHATGDVIATNWGWLQNWMGYWARSGTYAPNYAEETYTLTTNFQNGVWNELFDNAYDYQVMINKAKQKNAKYYEGVARIMKSLDFQILVDIYNNVPYSDALKGNGNKTPKYDKGLDIYKDLLRQIDTGIVLIKTATESQMVGIETNDIMFNGDTTLWAKFGNTLKLRILVHMMNGLTSTTVAPGIDLPAEFAKIALEGNGFLGAGESAMVQPGYKSDKPNPFYATYVADATGTATSGSVYFKANDWGLKYYIANGDPREGRLYKAGSGGFKGVAYGLPPVTSNAGSVLAGIGEGLAAGSTQASWVLTAAESLFLQAEAIERGYLQGDAQAVLEEAMLESFTWLHVADPADALADYLDNNAGFPDVDYTAPSIVGGQPGGGLYTILSQKWFALNGLAPFEIWTDVRRTNIAYGSAVGYTPGPALSVAPASTTTKIPTRLLYPQTEYNYNAKNVQEQGSIDRYGKIFWDIN